jgi:hypothetical protein
MASLLMLYDRANSHGGNVCEPWPDELSGIQLSDLRLLMELFDRAKKAKELKTLKKCIFDLSTKMIFDDIRLFRNDIWNAAINLEPNIDFIAKATSDYDFMITGEFASFLLGETNSYTRVDILQNMASRVCFTWAFHQFEETKYKLDGLSVITYTRNNIHLHRVNCFLPSALEESSCEFFNIGILRNGIVLQYKSKKTPPSLQQLVLQTIKQHLNMETMNYFTSYNFKQEDVPLVEIKSSVTWQKLCELTPNATIFLIFVIVYLYIMKSISHWV